MISWKETILALYLLTWLVGDPLVILQNRGNAYDLYQKNGGVSTGTLPGMKTDYPYWYSFPAAIFPGVIISIDGYQIAPLYGMGTWDIYVFYFFGVKKVAGIMSWIS
jgi:hypothetical protein